MSYSPFAVLGTSARIKADRDRVKESQPTEKKEEEKIDYTEQFRRTYFPHLAKKQLTNNQLNVIMIIEREVKIMWIERTNDPSYPYRVNDSWGGKAYITSLEDLKKEIRKIEKENKEKGIDK